MVSTNDKALNEFKIQTFRKVIWILDGIQLLLFTDECIQYTKSGDKD